MLDMFGTGLILGLFIAVRSFIDKSLTGFADAIWTSLTQTALVAGFFATQLWIFINGYLIVTGASREPLTAFLFKAFRVWIFMALATGTALINGNLRDEVGEFVDILGGLITGSSTPIFTQIDTNLNKMSVAAAAVSAASGMLAGGVGKTSDSGEALMALCQIVAVAAPVVTLSVTVLTLEAAVKFGAALAPIFFFLGIFQRFSDWPWAWGRFMFATIVSVSVTAGISSAALGAYAAFLSGSLVGSLLNTITGGLVAAVPASGVMATGGILISALMISIPSMIMRLFSLASEGAVRDVLGTGGTGGGGRTGNDNPQGKDNTSTAGDPGRRQGELNLDGIKRYSS